MTAEELIQWWSFVFLGVLVYTLGQQVKLIFPKLVAKAWYQRTIVFHAPIVATAIASLPIFPMPESIGAEIGTRLLFGAVAGICSSWSYKALMRLLGRDSKSGSRSAAPKEDLDEDDEP
ncbi:MAG: hypothetical protein EBS53_00095 [Bacteroidetes bacterium]|jgi:hypothetical protein|nr:hypothetical protein [Bacteroidota bacterium]